MTYFEKLRALPAPLRLSQQKAKDFARQLEFEERRRRNWLASLRASEKMSAENILRWIREAQRSGDLDEALWRGFLATHFGADSTESPGNLLLAFGKAPEWTWSRVSNDLTSFKSWLLRNQRRLVSLRFGNHRKLEAKQAAILSEVIQSFVNWVEDFGGTPQAAFATQASHPEERFDILFRRLMKKRIFRFGRLAVFDMLSLLGDMEVLLVRPGSCYLHEATGPVLGAQELWGRRPIGELARLADQAAQRLGVPYEVFEDALCNWQKTRTRRRGGPSQSLIACITG